MSVKKIWSDFFSWSAWSFKNINFGYGQFSMNIYLSGFIQTKNIHMFLKLISVFFYLSEYQCDELFLQLVRRFSILCIDSLLLSWSFWLW